MKTAVSIPDPIFRSAETLARRLKVSRSRLYALALAEFLAQHRRSRITMRLDEVYAGSELGIDPGTLALQLRSLADEEW